MTARRSWADAETVAQRMNARILPEGCDGGQWFPARASNTVCYQCEGCGSNSQGLFVATFIGGGGHLTLCLDCALLDCMGVKS